MIYDIIYNYIMWVNKECKFCNYAFIIKFYKKINFIKYK